MADPKDKELGFFNDIARDIEVSPEAKAELAKFKDEKSGEESAGLPIVYPKVEILHQGTAAFRLVDSDEIMKNFKAVIIHVEPQRAFWTKSIGEAGSEGGTPPDCWSRDGIAPDQTAQLPQNEKCGPCEKNQWGSDVKKDGTMGRGKACKEIRRLFIMIEGHMAPYWMPTPPTSLRALAQYFAILRDKGVKRPQEVVTNFRAKTVENNDGIAYSELALEMVGKLPENVLANVILTKRAIEEMLTRAAPITKEEYEGKTPTK